MKVKFWCNSGVNIHSCNEETVDISDYGFSDEAWESLSDDDKYKEAQNWAYESGLEIGYETVD